MALLDLIRVGLLSGIPVAVVTGLLFMLRLRTSPVTKTMKLPATKAAMWGGLWAFAFVAAVVMGVIGAWVYEYVRSSWGWGPTEYLLLGVGLAVVLSVLTFLPIYKGKRMTGAADMSALNLIVGVGFGVLVPYFAA